MATSRDFLTLTNDELMQALLSGHAIEPHALDDSEYRGISLGLPRLFEKLTWKVFQKTFHRDPSSGVLRGWNVRLEQNEIDGPCIPKTRHGTPVTFGHYRVVSPDGYRMPVDASAGLVIDYGLGGNGSFDFTRRVRDPLVAINPGSVELLLGWSYVDLGWLRFGTPSFFTLERYGPLSNVVDPPRRPTA